MKAMVLKGPNTPFEMMDVPDPVAGPGEAVARVLACGAGLTIQHIKAGRIAADFPRIIGHEITGEIVEAGAGVSGLAVGDAVTAYYYLNCGHCRWCLANLEPLCENSGGNVGRNCDGGYAQYIKLPAHVFIKLPAGPRLQGAPGGDRRDHRCARHAVQGAQPGPRQGRRDRRGVRRRRRRRHPPGDDGEMGEGAGDRRRCCARQVRRLPQGRRRRRGRRLGGRRGAGAARSDARAGVDVAIDYVSVTSTLEAGAKALGRRGRLVTLGGAGKSFQASSLDMLLKEQDLLGSRYVTRREILETLDLVARGEVWPLVTDIRPLAEAEALHERLERGEVTGRAALLIS